MENSAYLDLVKRKSEYDGINMKFISILEIHILNNSRKFYNFSAEEIYENLLKLINYPDNQILKEKFDIFLYFCISESMINLNFDMFTLSCACLLLAMNSLEEETYQFLFRNALYEMGVKVDKIESCISLIEECLWSEKQIEKDSWTSLSKKRKKEVSVEKELHTWSIWVH